ncbi:MAG: TolC family protein [Bacteroidales bacterium]|nr:TolC family protein [Bacteroidales bacterium]
MKRIITLGFVLLGLQLHSQTLEECHRLAKENYPEIKRYELIDKSEQYNIKNALMAWAPQINISGQATYQSATPTYPEVFDAFLALSGIDMLGIDKFQYKAAIDVNQTIWDGGYSKANLDIAKADAKAEKKQNEISLYDLQSRVNDIYFGVLVLEERKAQTENLIEILESNLNRMKVYQKNDIAMQSDVDAIEVELLSAKQNLAQITSSLKSFRQMLEIFIGQKLKDEKLQRPAMIEIANQTSNRAELQLFDLQKEKLSSQRKVINSSLMPHFSLFGQVYYGYPGLDMFKSMIENSPDLNAIAGIRMSWNLGGFYTRKNSLNKISIAERQIEIQKDVFLFNTSLQLSQNNSEIERLKQALEDDEKIIDLRRSIRIAAESKMENGLIDATELLQKINEESISLINRSQHEIELLQNIYKIKQTLNQ